MAKKNEVALIRRGNSSLMRCLESQDEYVTPATDIFETADLFILKLDVPGAQKESIRLSVEPTILTLRAKVKPHHGEKANLLFNEISSKHYHRTFNLRDGIDQSKIQAEFEDGVLTISLPKTEQMKAKEIPIT